MRYITNGRKNIRTIRKNIDIDVKFIDFNHYAIIIKIDYKGVKYESKIQYKYNNNLTMDANIIKIIDIIDSEVILDFYKKGEE